jgi:predicted O-methyltransferase YrrM
MMELFRMFIKLAADTKLKIMKNRFTHLCIFIIAATLSTAMLNAADAPRESKLDMKVRQFLKKNQSNWKDLNIPYEDGQVLYDLIVENGYTRALEIGTSTGHSSIWIAWALSKTGGKLVTIEIDEERHKQALANFREAGVEEYIDARLADAHQLVKELPGPFDFVFSDADKDWYVQYFKDVDPKLKEGGAFTAHNVTMRGQGIRDFVDYVTSRTDYATTIDRTSRAGISISIKK